MASYANVAGTGRPAPEHRLRALANFYKDLKPSVILREALGYYNNDVLPNTPDIGAPLVEHMITICVDTESHTLNTDQMTELGLSYITRKDARAVGNPGPHGMKLQESLKFLHFRIAEHAHLRSNREDSLGPLGNRFGKTRFTTFKELRVILKHLFNKEIETNDPALKGCKCPIVLVGHALKHDEENARKEGLKYDFADNSTIVAKVDTQPLAREVKVWIPPPGMSTNEIGLRVLIEKLGFQHLDDHTACNVAARTMMCAIHMILPENLQLSKNPSMQVVSNRVEALSKESSPAPYGTSLCCTRCGWRDHSIDECQADVTCAACNKFDVGPDRLSIIHSHIETYCPHVAKFKAWARRYKDAAKKFKSSHKPFSAEILQGPGPDAHPWSTWRGPRDVMWPLEDLSDVLVGMNMAKNIPSLREPPAFARNMQSALGGLPVPSTGTWVMMTPLGSSKRTTARSSNTAPPMTKGNKASTPTYTSLLATCNSFGSGSTNSSSLAPATARRETKMSEQRERGDSDVRSHGSGLCGRSIVSNTREGGRGGEGNEAATGLTVQNPWGFNA